MIIVVSKEFTETPSGRYKSHGEFSGEELRDKLLAPKFLEAKAKGEKLVINLDGGYGYAACFLEEAFGGLARKYGAKEVGETLTFISEDEPPLIDDIREYISDMANWNAAK